MCECGIVVVMRRLLRKGLPLACCIAYMLAGPIINLIVILSTWVAFVQHGIGPEMVALRVGLGFVTACVTALVCQRLYTVHGNTLLTPLAAPPAPKDKKSLSLDVVEEDAPPPAKKPFFKRLGNISETALHDFIDITVFLILGAMLGAFAKQWITPERIGELSVNQPALAILAMMGTAVVMCLCSEADAFVAASFTQMHVSSKLAFLVLGPMLDLKLLFMFTRVFRPRLILTIALCTTIQVFLYCYAVHLVYQANGWTGLPTGVVSSQAQQ
jgi:hypothetical protein